MDWSTPGFSVLYYPPELAQTHVHWVSDTIQPSHPAFLASGSFLMSLFFTSGGQSIGVSASASVLPMNIYSWFPLGMTSYYINISLLHSLSCVLSELFCASSTYINLSHFLRLIWLTAALVMDDFLLFLYQLSWRTHTLSSLPPHCLQLQFLLLIAPPLINF